MRKIIAFVAFGLLTSFAAHAAKSYVGQCVYPVTVQAKNGGLSFKRPVFISVAPASSDGQNLKSLDAFTVKAETAKQIQLVTVPDYGQADPNKDAGKIIGWGQKSDFVFQDLRNCN